MTLEKVTRQRDALLALLSQSVGALQAVSAIVLASGAPATARKIKELTDRLMTGLHHHGGARIPGKPTLEEVLAVTDANREAMRAESAAHAALLEAFKEQLLIVFINRLSGKVAVPVAEVDATSPFIMSFHVVDGSFHFEVSKKQ